MSRFANGWRKAAADAPTAFPAISATQPGPPTSVSALAGE
jgi:hypothetical protein